MRLIINLALFTAILWVFSDLQMPVFATFEFFAVSRTLFLLILRFLGILKRPRFWLYQFFGAWQIWLIGMDSYLLCSPGVQIISIGLFLIINWVLAAVVWVDILFHP